MIPALSHFIITALLVVACSPSAWGCSCFPFWGELCDKIITVEIVLRATILNRTEDADINEDTIYSLQSVEVFKADRDDDIEYSEGSTFDIAMPGNDGLCGIYLEVGDDYLVDLSRSEYGGDEELRSVGLCGLTQTWSSLGRPDKATLREGCDDYDPCEGACDEFQECVMGSTSSVGYYCQGTCNTDPCGDGEECVLVSLTCDLGEVCIREATCEQASQSTGSPSPVVVWDSAATLPPVGTIDPSASDTSSPSSSELTDTAQTWAPVATIKFVTSMPTPSPTAVKDVVMTLPPGASIDSTTDGSATLSPTGLRDVAMTLPPGATIDSTTDDSATVSPAGLRDVAMTLPPGATIDSTTGGSGTPSPTGLGDVAMTLPPGATMDSTTVGSGAPSSSNFRDVATIPPSGATVRSSSTFDTVVPTTSPTISMINIPTVIDGSTEDANTLSPTASPSSTARGFDADGETAAPSGDTGLDGSNGAAGGFLVVAGAGWRAAFVAAAAAGAGVLGGDVLFAV